MQGSEPRQTRTIDGDNPGAERLRTLGELMYLAFRVGTFGHANLDAVRMMLQPPVDLDQVVVFRDGERPVASISWAFLSEEAEAKVLGNQPLAPSEWCSGDRMWMMDTLSLLPPKMGFRAIRRFLDSIPPHITRCNGLRLGPNASLERVIRMERQNGKWRLNNVKHLGS